MNPGLRPTFRDRGALALAAAHQATEATTELLRFAREGEGPSGPFETEAIEKLADALKLAMEVEGDEANAEEDRDRLYSALAQFLEGWA